MTVAKQIRRRVERDAHKALHALPQIDDNPNSYEVGLCADEHFEKFAEMCPDIDRDELVAHVRRLGKEMTKVAQRMASGEMFYAIQEQMKEQIEDRVHAFERRFARQAQSRGFSR